MLQEYEIILNMNPSLSWELHERSSFGYANESIFVRIWSYNNFQKRQNLSFQPVLVKELNSAFLENIHQYNLFSAESLIHILYFILFLVPSVKWK